MKKNMAGLKLYIDPEHRLSLTLLPCGAVEHEDLQDLARALDGRGMRVTIAKSVPVPPQAFKPRRQQYRADDLLEVAWNEPGDRVLVVTDCDLYAGDFNFALGLAEAPGKRAVISLFRLRTGADKETFRRRAVKEAVHELGHTFGLSHCANPGCVMRFSNSLADTDRKGSQWCESCEQELQASRGNIPHLQQDGG
jgi:archaemetzincin